MNNRRLVTLTASCFLMPHGAMGDSFILWLATIFLDESSTLLQKERKNVYNYFSSKNIDFPETISTIVWFSFVAISHPLKSIIDFRLEKLSFMSLKKKSIIKTNSFSLKTLMQIFLQFSQFPRAVGRFKMTSSEKSLILYFSSHLGIFSLNELRAIDLINVGFQSKNLTTTFFIDNNLSWENRATYKTHFVNSQAHSSCWYYVWTHNSHWS